MMVERTIHFSRIAVFTLGSRDSYSPDLIEKRIEADLRQKSTALQSIENRSIVFGQNKLSRCVLVEESGLPPGKSEGSFLARKAAYQIDVAKGTVQRIVRCPGAAIR
jgi:hypothetical protein